MAFGIHVTPVQVLVRFIFFLSTYLFYLLLLFGVFFIPGFSVFISPLYTHGIFLLSFIVIFSLITRHIIIFAVRYPGLL